MSRLVRSFKLLAALPVVDHVLHTDWLVDSAKAGHFVDPNSRKRYAANDNEATDSKPAAATDDAVAKVEGETCIKTETAADGDADAIKPSVYHLDDSTFRNSFNCKIADVLAAANRRQLFANCTFHLTPSVRPIVRDLQQLIELCGGRVERSRRSAARIAEANQQSAGSYVILSCAADLHLLADLMRPGRPNRAICATEFVMMAILQQRIDMDKHVIKYSSV